MEEKFKSDFEKALGFLEQERRINLFEDVAHIFASSESSKESFIAFQVQLLSIVGQTHAPSIMHYLKSDIEYTPSKRERITFAILKKIKLLINYKFNAIEKAMSTPFKMMGTMFSYSKEYPSHLTVNFMRADGENFIAQLTINDALILINQISENFTDKVNSGMNDFDTDLLNETKSSFDELNNKINEEIDLIKSNSKDK